MAIPIATHGAAGIALVQERVMQRHAIALHTEVKRLGPFEDIALAA